MSEHKQCARCQQVKLLAEFNQCKSRRDGLQPKCRACQGEHYQETKAHRLAHRQRYYRANLEEQRAASRAYYYAHKEQALATRRAWRDRNREHVRARRRANYTKRRIQQLAHKLQEQEQVSAAVRTQAGLRDYRRATN
jgi:hypothetical protein